MNSVLNLRVPYTAGKLSSVLTTRDLLSSAQLHGVIYILNSLALVRERTIPTGVNIFSSIEFW
jgi:hypothetical protein